MNVELSGSQDDPSNPDPLALALGAASLGLGIWGILWPRQLGAVLGTDQDTARLIGFRDVGLALPLLGWGSRPALLSRAVLDLGDAFVFRHRPLIAVGAAA